MIRFDVGEVAPLAPIARQRLDGWVAMLDVDLEAAQAALRLPAAHLPVPPIALPELRDRHGLVLAEAVAAPDLGVDDGVPVSAPAPTVLRGAYARRARK